ncbi:hypothetical protein ASPWEDRAFT_54675 [Aspergillus wentii DTO 134E9]|uniref:CBM21 domain-containing protein n=1 Tax=Aspergillus wentii DTO 134E9 TaxID=1073089 RepID=A0A1L9R9E4_ASPWE|nr:uncharacterized protein ASPWEDRAFT_54675 [Aspergillus wentii DTO 134E9]OJJ31544.1 hypothetical protein ASPWEDRAFT_54675 [Aspergillus wentii DTO 134E9]
MPYTAPLKSSPFAQHIEFSEPVIPHSYPETPRRIPSPTGRPPLSRSYSSTAYVRRHRRSPSASKNFVFPDPASKSKYVLDSQSSVRQSPPPLSDAIIPPGAVISPPESAPNSSDEEASYHRPEGPKMEELEAAVRSLGQRRESSPERSPSVQTAEKPTPSPVLVVKTKPAGLPLSKEARKISHSRSSTESSILPQHEEAVTSSPDDSDRDDEPKRKPPMLRKKSGELVRPALRPASARRRPSSMPGTPTYSKAVHFDSQLEHIRHFLQLDKPLAVSANTSPVEDYAGESEFPFGKEEPAFEWQIHLPNFPKDPSSRGYQKVKLERVSLSSDQNTLVGVIAVANLAFHKHVAARFTFDYWRTVSEVTAEYSHDVRRKQIHDGYDRFSFEIKLNDQANLEKKTMFVCIRYNVDGREFWDNNNAMNYQIDFLRVLKAKPENRSLPTSGSRNPLPRSRTFNARPHSMPPSFENLSEFSFGSPKKSANKKVSTKEPSEDDIEPIAPVRRERQDRQAFGNRYDFGASLSAVMRTKPSQDRTTLTARAKSEPETQLAEKKKEPGLVSNKALPVSEVSPHMAHSVPSEPSSLVSGKPHLESSVYKELVDKYCFYGSPRSSISAQSPSTADKDSAAAEKGTSPSSPPSSPPSTSCMDFSVSRNPRETRSSSSTNSSSRASSSSPANFGYSYHQPTQNNFMKGSHTPAVIRG